MSVKKEFSLLRLFGCNEGSESLIKKLTISLQEKIQNSQECLKVISNQITEIFSPVISKFSQVNVNLSPDSIYEILLEEYKINYITNQKPIMGTKLLSNTIKNSWEDEKLLSNAQNLKLFSEQELKKTPYYKVRKLIGAYLERNAKEQEAANKLQHEREEYFNWSKFYCLKNRKIIGKILDQEFMSLNTLLVTFFYVPIFLSDEEPCFFTRFKSYRKYPYKEIIDFLQEKFDSGNKRFLKSEVNNFVNKETFIRTAETLNLLIDNQFLPVELFLLPMPTNFTIKSNSNESFKLYNQWKFNNIPWSQLVHSPENCFESLPNVFSFNMLKQRWGDEQKIWKACQNGGLGVYLKINEFDSTSDSYIQPISKTPVVLFTDSLFNIFGRAFNKNWSIFRELNRGISGKFDKCYKSYFRMALPEIKQLKAHNKVFIMPFIICESTDIELKIHITRILTSAYKSPLTSNSEINLENVIFMENEILQYEQDNPFVISKNKEKLECQRKNSKKGAIKNQEAAEEKWKEPLTEALKLAQARPNSLGATQLATNIKNGASRSKFGWINIHTFRKKIGTDLNIKPLLKLIKCSRVLLLE